MRKQGIKAYKEKIVIKEKNPKSETHRIDIEAQFLPKLNKKGIGPKFIFFENSSLGMEYVEGELLEKHILHAERGEIMRILAEIVKQLYDMDMMGIGKEEMQNPYKHIIIRNGKPVMIDFERCHHTEKPKNITQFLRDSFAIQDNARPVLCPFAARGFHLPPHVLARKTQAQRKTRALKHHAAELLVLDAGHLHAELRRPDGRHVSARPRSDHDQVEAVATRLASHGCLTLEGGPRAPRRTVQC